ncbi:Uncharacterised protein [Raoultella terrigena]|uniref:Uncharacterized protein n=1 Tax=Raoultella terrigena TaxID=577 RepID=A0A3P8JXH8_RAOTE|nr:Uncharacterised protein [Raoultella terrigena]
MPQRSCTLKISPLVRELILTLAGRSATESDAPATRRLVQVLFDELPQQPEEHLQLPVSAHPKIRQMAELMAVAPAQWQTLGQWAAEFAMSERNLARLVVRENRPQLSPLAPSAAADPRAADADPRANGAADRARPGI